MNVSVSDNGVFQSVSFYLYNASHYIVNSTINYTSSSIVVNFSGLAQGSYKINATANDSYGNRNWSENRVFLIDTTAPTVTLGTPEVTPSSVYINITISDSSSGVSSVCTSNRPTATVSGNSTNQRLTESSLTCLSTYNYTITCTDTAGNSKSQNATATTSACTNSGNSGSSITSSSQWKLIYIINESEAGIGYTKELANSEAIRLKVAGTDHHVGVVNISSLGATINVTSNPQQAFFSIGQTRQFEVSGDLYYDINVTLISINSNKANIKVITIREPLPSSVIKQTGGAQTNSLIINSSNSSTNSTLFGAGSKVQSAGMVYWVALLFILSLIIIIVVFILVAYLRKSQKLDAQEW